MKRNLLIAAAIFVLLLIGAHAETEGAKNPTVQKLVDDMTCDHVIDHTGTTRKRCPGDPPIWDTVCGIVINKCERRIILSDKVHAYPR